MSLKELDINGRTQYMYKVLRKFDKFNYEFKKANYLSWVDFLISLLDESIEWVRWEIENRKKSQKNRDINDPANELTREINYFIDAWGVSSQVLWRLVNENRVKEIEEYKVIRVKLDKLESWYEKLVNIENSIANFGEVVKEEIEKDEN